MHRFISFVFMLLLSSQHSFAQIHSYESRSSGVPHATNPHDTLKVKNWLVKANDYYKRKISGRQSPDSTFFFIAAGKRLSFELHYTKGLQDALTLEAKIVHNNQQSLIDNGNNNPSFRTIDTFEKSTIKLMDFYGDRIAKATVLMILADSYDWRKEGSDRLIPLYKSAAILYKEMGHQKQYGIALIQLGQCQLHSEILNDAEVSFVEAVKILTPLKYPNMQMAYHGLSYVNISTGRYKEGTRYGLQAATLGEKLGDTTINMAYLYKNVGYCHEIASDFDNAAIYFNKALNIAKRNKYIPEIYASTSEVAKLMVRSSTDSAIGILQGVLRQYPLPAGNLAQREIFMQLLRCYNRKRQLNLAEVYANKMLAFANELPAMSLNRSYALSPVIDYYILSKQYPKAINLLTICKNIELQNKQLPALSGVYSRLYRIDSALKDYKSALTNYKQWKGLIDSLDGLAQEKQIAELRIEFEAEQQRKDIVLLQKENHLNTERLNRFSLERNAVIVFALLLLIIFCLLYYQFHLKKTANRNINSKNLVLEKLLQEKEWLLKEVHHRVKNNLQTVVSLLQSQSAKLQGEALDAIHESQHRVFAISLIHKKLYQAENIKTVEMSTYIPELVGYINEMLGRTSHITFQYDLTGIHLDVSQAVPVGLIVNESVTNAIKHAFPISNQSPAVIRITMNLDSNKRIQIIIEDNGIGISTDSLNGEGTGLGLRLLYGLSEDLEGNLVIDNKNGTRIILEFQQSVDFRNLG